MSATSGFHRILLATDGSDAAAAAVETVIAIVKGRPAEVRVVHVWNLEVHHRHGHLDVEVRSEARDLVEATVGRLRAAGIQAAGEIMRADHEHVPSAITSAAREFEPDLLVVGSRGLTEWQSIVRHSVSHQLLTALDCPILIVRGRPLGNAETAPRVLLAVAGGEDVAPVVRAAIAAAGRLGSKVQVVHVAQVVIGLQGFVLAETDGEAQATVAAALALLNDAGIPAEGVITHKGPVAEAIAEVAQTWNADVIVTGSSRTGDLTSLALGSVSRHLMRTTVRPVLIAERVLS